MAYDNSKSFTPTVRQNWICVGNGKESAFFLNQYGKGLAPEGAVRASDNYLTATQENITMNNEAGFLYNDEFSTFVKDVSADEAFPEFPASFTETQRAAAIAKGRRVKMGKISRDKLVADIAFHAENYNNELQAVHEYLVVALDGWSAE